MRWTKENWSTVSLLIGIAFLGISIFYYAYRQQPATINTQINQGVKQETVKSESSAASTTLPVKEVKQKVVKPNSKPQTPSVPPPATAGINLEQFTKDDNLLSAHNVMISQLYFISPGPREYCKIIWESQSSKQNDYWITYDLFQKFVNDYGKYQGSIHAVYMSIQNYNQTFQIIKGDCAKMGYVF